MGRRTNNSTKPVEKKEEIINEEITPVESEETVEEESTPVVSELIGVVSNCERLNIRKAPVVGPNVVEVVNVASELKIIDSMSNDEWLEVCTASGINGYCMKKFVSIK